MKSVPFSSRRGFLTRAPAALAVLLAGCQSLPPTLHYSEPRRAILPRSYKMKLAVFNFVDQTGSASKLVQTMPDILATELFSTGRFELLERAELREVDPANILKVRDEYRRKVDAFLVGSITRFSNEDKTMTLDLRIINASGGVSDSAGTVLYAGHHDVAYEGILDVRASRGDVTSVARKIQLAFPELGGQRAKVISRSGNLARINLGSRDGVKVGMGALVIAQGDTLKDPVTKEELSDEVYVGEVYVVQVSENDCAAMVFAAGVDEKTEKVKINDSVRFK